MFLSLAVFFVLFFPSGRAQATPIRCNNLDKVEDQGFPVELELQLGIKSEKQFSVLVKRKGEENSAIAAEGHSYHANRVSHSEEKRIGVPTYYVSDNPEGDRFADEERSTAVYLYAEKSLFQGKGGRLKLWLQYKGAGYHGVQADKYSCKVGL
ncbi:MAG TPA: hypothetical protein VIH99_03705 [Bdellovibrionota bacterium]